MQWSLKILQATLGTRAYVRRLGHLSNYLDSHMYKKYIHMLEKFNNFRCGSHCDGNSARLFFQSKIEETQYLTDV